MSTCRHWCSRQGPRSGAAPSCAWRGAIAGCGRTWSSSRSSLMMRSCSSRRSASIWVSPGPAHEAAAAALAFKVGPASDQPALLVIEMRKLDLQHAFLGGGPAAEDFENQPGAVDHLDLPFRLQIALLHRRERMVDDDQLRSRAVDQLLDLEHLALAEQRRRPRIGDRHDQGLGNLQDRWRRRDRWPRPCDAHRSAWPHCRRQARCPARDCGCAGRV